MEFWYVHFHFDSFSIERVVSILNSGKNNSMTILSLFYVRRMNKIIILFPWFE